MTIEMDLISQNSHKHIANYVREIEAVHWQTSTLQCASSHDLHCYVSPALVCRNRKGVATEGNYKACEYGHEALLTTWWALFMAASTPVNALSRILNLAACAMKSPYGNTLVADTKLCTSEMMLLVDVFWRSDWALLYADWL